MKSIYTPAYLALGATIAVALPFSSAEAISISETSQKSVLVNEHPSASTRHIPVSAPGEITGNNWLAQTETPQAWAKQGFDKFKQGDTKGALSDLDTSISLDAEFALAYMSRGLVYASVEDFTQAKQDTQLAAQLFQEQNEPGGHEDATQLLQLIDYLTQLQSNNPDEYQKAMQEIKSIQSKN